MKIDWLVKIVKEMKDEIACKNEVKMIIKEIIREEIESVKQEIEDMRKMIQDGVSGQTKEVKGSYNEAVKERKKEKVIIVKLKIEQESEATKKSIKEKINIKSMDVGISRLKKCSKGTVILSCETEKEIEKLKVAVQENMGEGFKVTESSQVKPKIKIVNVEEELQLEDEKLIDVIKTQNGIDEIKGREMKIVKRIIKGRVHERNGRGWEQASVIIEVDEGTHQELLNTDNLSDGENVQFITTST